jgi:hypothetical protein
MVPLFYAYLGQRGGGDVSSKTGKTNVTPLQHFRTPTCMYVCIVTVTAFLMSWEEETFLAVRQVRLL